MDHRAAGIALLLSLSFAARASGEEVDSRRPVHLGAMIGLVSLPRPVDAEIFVTVVDLLGIGFGYSDFPAFIANPLLELAGAKSDSINSTLSISICARSPSAGGFSWARLSDGNRSRAQ